MGDASTNGEIPHSATFDHIYSYPIVQDSYEAFKSNPYGQKSINLTEAAYAKLVKPTLPYFEVPASYAKPYVIKIDEYGNLFLSKVDEKVPILKSESKEVKSAVVGYIHWPFELANETKTKVLDTYNQEYKKCGGDGYVAGGKAIITSYLNLTSDALHWISGYLAAKKEQAKEVAKEAQKKAEEAAKKAEKKADEATN